MFTRILVGIDGHAGGRAALAFAEAIAEPGAEIELVHVYGYVTAFGDEGEDRYDRELRDHAWKLLEGARTAADRPVKAHAIRSSSTARGLHERAEDAGADLIVAGRSRRSAASRLVGGDTVRALMRSAPCAVALVPPGTPAPDPAGLRVTVGYDARPEAEAALRVARDLASRSGLPLHVVTAVSPPQMPADAFTIDVDQVVDRGCARARAAIDALGDGVVAGIEVGEPGAVLAAAAERSDVLVVGSRGYGPVRRLVLGSTSASIAARAVCPVIVVPRVTGSGGDDRQAHEPAGAQAA